MRLSKQGEANLLNKFRASDPRYAENLDPVTVENILDVGNQLNAFPQFLNDFMLSTVNKIVESYVESPMFTNPLARFKRRTERYGDTIEEVFIGLAKEHNYSPNHEGNGKNLFSTEFPDISAAYHKINRNKQFKTTILREKMSEAVVSDGGISRIVEMIIKSLVTSNQVHEYGYMKKLVDGAYVSGDLYYVVVGDLQTQESRLRFAEKARLYSDLATYINQFNALGVENVSPADELSIMVPSKTTAKLDVNVLASAFSMDKADFISKRIPVDKFGSDNIVAVMLQDDWFVVQDKHDPSMEAAYVTDARKWQYFYTVKQVLSRSPFSTGIVFVKELPEDVTQKLILSTESVVLGGYLPKTHTVTSSLIGFDDENDANDYKLLVTTDRDTVFTHTVVDGKKVEFTLKDDAYIGDYATATVTAVTNDVDETPLSKPKRITVQRANELETED